MNLVVGRNDNSNEFVYIVLIDISAKPQKSSTKFITANNLYQSFKRNLI